MSIAERFYIAQQNPAVMDFMAEFKANVQEKGGQQLLNLPNMREPVRIEIGVFGGSSPLINIDYVEAIDPNHGDGSKAMAWLSQLADKYGVTLTLSAMPLHGSPEYMKTPALMDWYNKFGFQAQTPKEKQPPKDRWRSWRGEMIRQPK